MYFFLATLSLLDTAYISNTVPRCWHACWRQCGLCPTDLASPRCSSSASWPLGVPPAHCSTVLCQPVHYRHLMGHGTHTGLAATACLLASASAHPQHPGRSAPAPWASPPHPLLPGPPPAKQALSLPHVGHQASPVLLQFCGGPRTPGPGCALEAFPSWLFIRTRCFLFSEAKHGRWLSCALPETYKVTPGICPLGSHHPERTPGNILLGASRLLWELRRYERAEFQGGQQNPNHRVFTLPGA